jgi:hypothetical protein
LPIVVPMAPRSKANRRRSERFPVRLSATVRGGRIEATGETRNVSAHGALLALERAESLRGYVDVALTLPDGRAVDVTAQVTRTVPRLDDGRSGLAVDFAQFTASTRVAWRAYLDQLRVGAADAAGALAWLEPDDLLFDVEVSGDASRLAVGGGEAAVVEVVASFLVKPRDVTRLWSFFRSELGAGRVKIETPVLHPPGTHVEIVVIHPVSRAEWARIGRVLSASQVGRGRGPMLEVGLDDLDDEARADFRHFISHGHRDVPAAEPATQEIQARRPDAHVSVPPIPLPASRPLVRADSGAARRSASPEVSSSFLVEVVPELPSALRPRRELPELGASVVPVLEPLVVPPSEARTPPPVLADSPLMERLPFIAPQVVPHPDAVATGPGASEEDTAADTPDRRITARPRAPTFAAFFEEFRARHPTAPEVRSGPSPTPSSDTASPRRVDAEQGTQPEAPPRRADEPRAPDAHTEPGAELRGRSAPPPLPDVVRPTALVEGEEASQAFTHAEPMERGGPPERDAAPSGPASVAARAAHDRVIVERVAVDRSGPESAASLERVAGERLAVSGPVPAAPITVVGAPADTPSGESTRGRSKLVEAGGRGGHRAVSTAGENPELDRDIAVARARVVRSPASSTACYRLGRLLVQHPDASLSAEGRAQLGRAIELGQEHPSAELARAALALERGDVRAAEQHLAHATRLGARRDAALEAAIRARRDGRARETP